MHNAREEIIRKFRNLVEEVHKIEKVEIYGSYVTNLYLPWSDIDFVSSSKCFSGDEWLEELHSQLILWKENENWIKEINYIKTATVPIIKLSTLEEGYDIKVDITFGDEDHKGNQCVELGKFWTFILYSQTISQALPHTWQYGNGD